MALVIGNASYKDSPLLNPVNDARAVAGALRHAGFQVVELHNAGSVPMRRAIREFGERLRQNGAGLFYFAGHGVQVRGRNFLVPVDADVRYEDEIEDQSIDVALVLGKMESAKSRVNLVILDACRNNPFVRNTRSLANGLAPMEAPIGTLIAFATSPGQVASDGSGSNGLYTEYLVREIRQPGMKVEDVFKRVRASVRTASSGRQVPWENTSLEGDFYFYQPQGSDPAVQERERRRQQDEAVQAAVRDALSRSREENERERSRLEEQYARKLEEQREAMRKEAIERIASIEKAAVTATRPAPAMAAAPEQARRVDETSNEMPESFMLAMGIDPAKRNRIHPVAEDIAQAISPSRPQQGDAWTYFREMREGGVTRRNYLSRTVADVDAQGHTVVSSDAPVATRYDVAGNRISAPSAPPHADNLNVKFDPAEVLFRFPLAAGAAWSGSGREISSWGAVDSRTEVKVVGWEDVAVPAGTFKALKLAQIQDRAWEPFPGQRASAKRVTNVWYVPALRNVARMDILEVTGTGTVTVDQKWELDSFELNAR